MIDLMVKNIINNSTKINSISKSINSISKKHGTQMLLISIALYTICKTIKKQKEKIDDLEMEIEGIKSSLA